MKTAPLQRPRCALCDCLRRPDSSHGLCGQCAKTYRCRSCGLVDAVKVLARLCESCGDDDKHRRAIHRGARTFRPSATAQVEERIAFYRLRAECGLPLFGN